MRWLLAVLALALGGCSSPASDWHGDARFSLEERATIETGEAWVADHAGRAHAAFDWTYDVTSDEILPHTIRRGRGPAGELGTTGMCVNGTIYLDPDDRNAAPGTLEGLAAHEMAHCELGFVDDPGSDGVMHRLLPLAWTAREDAQLAKHDG